MSNKNDSKDEIVISLRYPLTTTKGPIDSLTLRTFVTVDDLLAADSETGELAKSRASIAALTGQSNEIIGRLHITDFKRIAEALEEHSKKFLSPATGATS